MSVVRPGYKQTEIGVIPNDWAPTLLASTASRSKNAIVGGPFGSDLVTADYTSSGVPVIRGQNMGKKYVDGDFVFVSELKAKKLNANCARASDLIFTQRGTLGQVALCPAEKFKKYLVSQSQMKISVDQSAYDPQYIYYYFSSLAGQKQILDSAIQTGVPHTNLSILRQYKLPIPNQKREQQAIAGALGDVDALIASLEVLIAKKRDIKQGAIQDLLTRKRRLPGFQGEWRNTVLGKCLARPPFYGISAAAVTYSDALPRYLRITDFSDTGKLIKGSLASVDHPAAAKYRLEDGDVVLARTGASVGKSFAFTTPDGPLIFAGFLICVRPNKDELVSKYLAAVLRTKEYWNWIGSVSMRSGQPGVNGKQYSSMPISLPSLDEQRAIAVALSDMEAEIVALEDKLAKAHALKQGMMQVLITGEVRLV